MSIAQSKFSNLTVLVVDDEPDNLELIMVIFRFYGVQAITACNGLEALNVLSQLTPDIILTDLSMPGMDGWTFLMKLREMNLSANPPVIAVTAHAESEARARVMQLGFDDYVTKPLDVRNLLSVILNQLEPISA